MKENDEIKQEREFAEKYPEHQRLKAVSNDSQTITNFLEWAQDRDWYLTYDGRNICLDINKILGMYFEIDENKIEKKKDK